MGGFYGYSPENFMPDTSIWAKLGGIANETLQKLPEAIELEKAYHEGKTNNGEIYGALSEQLKNVSDDDMMTYFGESKDVVLKRLKPGRGEGAEYMVRSAKIMEKYLPIKAKENFTTAQSEIVAPNKSDEKLQNMSPAIAGPISAFNQALGKPEPSSPEQVQSIARKYNVPLDKLQPEMTQAKNRVDAQQLRQIDTTGTIATNIQNIGGEGRGIGDNTMKAISNLPNETQEAAAIISASNSENDRYKAVTDRLKAGNDANKEKRQSRNELLNLKKTYQNEIKLAQTELSKVTDDLQKPAPLGADEDTMKEWESTRKSLVSRQKTLTRDLRNAKKEANDADKLLKQENGIPPTTYIDDEVWDAYDQVTSGSESDLPGMNDSQYKKQNEAYSLAEVANKTWGISISPEAISNEIKNGATPLQILQALFENSMGQ